MCERECLGGSACWAGTESGPTTPLPASSLSEVKWGEIRFGEPVDQGLAYGSPLFFLFF